MFDNLLNYQITLNIPTAMTLVAIVGLLLGTFLNRRSQKRRENRYRMQDRLRSRGA